MCFWGSVSPYEEAAVASIDGFGDFASAAWGMGRGAEITVDDKVYFPHSLGTFYQALTQFIGFPNYGDEYKVMGLAPYGKPAYLDQIRYCLDEGDINLSDVAYVAINSDPKANLIKKIGFTLKKRPELGLIMDRLKYQNERRSIEQELSVAFPDQEFKGQVKHVEHHLAHLSSAFHVSPYEEAAVASIDGFGDFASAAWGMGRGAEITVDDKVYFPHSLGTFYQALTQFIGFPNYGDEYKVMGLAPYGKPAYLDQMRQIVLLQDDGSYRLNMDYFIYHKEKIDYEWEDGSPSVGRLFSDKLAELLGPVRVKGETLAQKHMDIAHSVQAMYDQPEFCGNATEYFDALDVAGMAEKIESTLKDQNKLSVLGEQSRIQAGQNIPSHYHRTLA